MVDCERSVEAPLVSDSGEIANRGANARSA
jgi:hypothetical protein